MKWLITGLGGTLAPMLAQAARARGVKVLGWNRHQIDPQDSAAAQAWLRHEAPDAIAHLALGPLSWAQQLAAHAAEAGKPFVLTSTAMVFDHQPDGPHAPADPRNARDDYGRSKIGCEDAVLAAHPQAMVARIGWQIDPAQPGNNMLMALDRWQAEQGEVAASRAWTPACSFMADTAAALAQLLCVPVPGVHHLDSNADEAWRFDQIVRALQQACDRPHWRLRVHDDYRHDQRLVGGPTRLPPLSQRLPLAR